MDRANDRFPLQSAYLSLGSNLGDRRGFLSRALSRLELDGNRITACSSLYETEPVDLVDQPSFLNLVCYLRSPFEPEQLLYRCQIIETDLGRHRSVPKGPRVIDIDLLYFEDRMIHTPELTLPHPSLQDRRFVLEPLMEIAPHFRDPRTGDSVQMLLEHCPDRSWVRRIGEITW
jgi:2-amino-4-hydroxy-6-hydroxymethyldihydropteridine diphosphokinase